MMAKGSLYPFKIRVREPELIKVYKLLSTRRAVKIPDQPTSVKLSRKLSPIRQDIFIGPDTKYKYKSYISLPPELDLEMVKCGSAYDFIFKPIVF